jgi:hypothetical protein
MLIKDTNLLFLTFCKLIVLVHNQIAVKKKRMLQGIIKILLEFKLSNLCCVNDKSDNFYNSDGKDCNCVPLILQKNNKLKLQ